MGYRMTSKTHKQIPGLIKWAGLIKWSVVLAVVGFSLFSYLFGCHNSPWRTDKQNDRGTVLGYRGIKNKECISPWGDDKQYNRGEIQWFECKGFGAEFDCGTLYAPLDYTNDKDPRNATIAVIRYKAGRGQTPRSEVLGSVLLNPGGPGASGLSFLGSSTANISELTKAAGLDKWFDSKYDLVSFDPRGVGETWPKVQCFGDTQKSLYNDLVSTTYGLPGEHGSKIMKHEIGALLAVSQLLGEVCGNNKDAELFEYMSTPFVARDMQLLHRALGDPKLNYWGYSYGTILGSTYADMFPQDVNRLLIDGVVDAPNYYEGLWSHNFKDIEAEVGGFFAECVNSGPSNCKLAELASNASDLKKIVLDYGDKLKVNPIPVPSADPPRLLTYYDFITTFFHILYAPIAWKPTAESLYAAIAEGNTSAILESLDLHPKINMESEAFEAIACGDAHAPPAAADGSSMWDIQQYKDHVAPIIEDSPLFAHMFGRIAPLCKGSWQKRAAETHWGNFTSETSFPILALGNDFDPATPGRYADKMAGLFPNAVSVRREGYGHCSMSQPSKCIRNIVHNYFVKGELPEPGTKCAVDVPVFSDWTKESAEMLPVIFYAH